MNAPRINRVVHMGSLVAFKPFSQIAPDVKHKRTDGGEGEVMAIAFQDADGEVNVFPLSEEQIEKLRMDLSGGIVVPVPGTVLKPVS